MLIFHMVAKRYSNNTKASNGGKFVVGGSGNVGNVVNNAVVANNTVAQNTQRTNPDDIKFMIDGKNALIFARSFRTKARNTQMIKFIIYDFDAKKKYSSAVPLAVVVKTAFPSLQLNLEEIGDLTPQPPTKQ
jgi:hypothetical protein